jgi:hypothetical protein
MNTSTHNTVNASNPASQALIDAVTKARLFRRERDFGIGYGRSSGYGLDRRYTSDWGAPRFRFR